MTWRKWCIGAAAAAALAATDAGKPVAWRFEREPRELGTGRSPKLLARLAHGLQVLWVAPAAGGKGQDLFFQASSDHGDTFTDPLRVNDAPGEVSDHGENSPVLAASPDGRRLYAVWSARDPRTAMGTNIRFSRAVSMRPSFAPAVTVNDDGLPVSHSFQTLGVAPDGTVYVAWLDGRDNPGHGGAHGATSSIYVARSTNEGQSFEKNVRVTDQVCPCCRPSITFAGDKVLVAWRRVEAGDIRDVFVASSSDQGQTWSKPVLAGRDGWKINGCPHVGPSIATLGAKVYAAWFTEGSGDPAIYLAVSEDGGRSFGPKQKISEGTLDPTHPQLAAAEGRLAAVFQARSAAGEQGWGRIGVYYRELYPDGTMSPLVRLPEGKANASYPSVALGMSGRVYVGWTESQRGASAAYLVRGRSVAKGL
jgi:hypothetical protein